jgi:hypothetical protein
MGLLPDPGEKACRSQRKRQATPAALDIGRAGFPSSTAPLQRLAPIVRGADTARPELAPQAAGLLAASLGLSRMHRDDLAQLEAAMPLYDAFYRWCRDAVEETHNWPTPRQAP